MSGERSGVFVRTGGVGRVVQCLVSGTGGQRLPVQWQDSARSRLPHFRRRTAAAGTGNRRVLCCPSRRAHQFPQRLSLSLSGPFLTLFARGPAAPSLFSLSQIRSQAHADRLWHHSSSGPSSEKPSFLTFASSGESIKRQPLPQANIQSPLNL